MHLRQGWVFLGYHRYVQSKKPEKRFPEEVKEDSNSVYVVLEGEFPEWVYMVGECYKVRPDEGVGCLSWHKKGQVAAVWILESDDVGNVGRAVIPGAEGKEDEEQGIRGTQKKHHLGAHQDLWEGVCPVTSGV